MIYFIWEMDEDLLPSIAAFSNKKDFEAAQEICKAKFDESWKSSDDSAYRWGEHVIPYARSQKKLCENITHACLGFDLMGAVESQMKRDAKR